MGRFLLEISVVEGQKPRDSLNWKIT